MRQHPLRFLAQSLIALLVVEIAHLALPAAPLAPLAQPALAAGETIATPHFVSAALLPNGQAGLLFRNQGDFGEVGFKRFSSAQAMDPFPLSFEANVGQTDARVDFLARGSGYSVFLTQGDAVLALRAPEPSRANAPEGLADRLLGPERRAVTVGALRMHVLGGNPAARAAPERRLPGAVNYFIGNDPRQWRVGVPTYARINYPAIYPGIDLAYYGAQGRLEYDFVVGPGADPSAIALRFEGAQNVELTAGGDVVLRLGGQEIRQTKPLLYQEIGGERREVAGGYVLREADTLGFQVGDYDPSAPLVIDPSLVYSTYLGGSGDEIGFGIAVDGGGSAYVTGVTPSTNFPTSTGVFDTTLDGGLDAFVTKLNPAGSDLLYSTYLGGSGDDEGRGIAVDSAGSAYVTGDTTSTNFPTSTGAFDTSLGGTIDAFVTKLNPTGTGLLYSTYLGGGGEIGFDIAVDTAGSAYVTGDTTSTNFPTSTGAFDTTLDGGLDAFVTKLNPAGSGLLYSTYLGGSDQDEGRGIAVDSAGSAYVTGRTGSTNFPTSAGAFDTALGGSFDAFVTKLNATGSGLLYSAYLGGSEGDEFGSGIAVNSTGSAYVTGDTTSTNFPTSAGAFDTTLNGGDAFVTKLNPAGSSLLYSTYLGGSAGDDGSGIAVDSAGSAYVTGVTGSTNFPTSAGAFDATLDGVDAFVTKLNPTGGLLYSTYLGGGGEGDNAFGIAVDSAGSAYVTGGTTSTNFPTSAGAFDTSFNGTRDAFVTKIIPIGAPERLAGLIFVHGIRGDHTDDASFGSLLGPLRNTRELLDFRYFQDVGDLDGSGQCRTRAAIIPANTGGLPLTRTPRSLDLSICDSQSDVGLNAILLDEDVREMSRRIGGPVTLISNSMGGAIVRAFLAYAAKANTGALAMVDQIYFLQAAHQGSYLAYSKPALGALAVRRFGPLIGPIVFRGAAEAVRQQTGWDPTRPAVDDLTPVLSETYRFVNPDPAHVPQGIGYLNVASEIHLALDVGLFGNRFRTPGVPLGDFVILPGSDDPRLLPLLGGARFDPGVLGRRADDAQYLLEHDLLVRLEAFVRRPTGTGIAVDFTFPQAPLDVPESHLQLGVITPEGSARMHEIPVVNRHTGQRQPLDEVLLDEIRRRDGQ